MKCECGGSLCGYTATKKLNGKQYSYYKCHNWQSKGHKVCKGNTLIKNDIEKTVLKEVHKKARLHFEKGDVQKLLQEKNNTSKEPLQHVETYINRLKGKQNRLIELFEDGSIDKNLLVNRIDTINSELQQAENQYQSLKVATTPKEKSNRMNLLQMVNKLNETVLSLPDETKKDVLHQLIRRIVVKRTKQIEIELYLI